MAQDNSYTPPPPVPNNTQPAANGKSYLSLPQILGLVEKRILAIESAMQEQKSAPSTVGVPLQGYGNVETHARRIRFTI